MANLKMNYPRRPFKTVGYYRDYQLRKDAYVNLHEAILEVFDQGFAAVDDSTTATRILEDKLNASFSVDSIARAAYDYTTYRKVIDNAHLDAYGGNEFRILRIHDAIRNYNVRSYDFLGALERDFLKEHFFRLDGEAQVEGISLHKIRFFMRNEYARVNGHIYISKRDFAIYKLEYAVFDNFRRNESKTKNKYGHKQKLIFEITTDYRPVGSHMYLNYISFHNNFKLNLPPKFKSLYKGFNTTSKTFLLNSITHPIACKP